MTRLLRWLLAGTLAALLSQFPAFSDQYVQRLGGQVDALAGIAREFDASAARAGLDREAALRDLSGSGFRDAHAEDMRRAFLRLDRARADYDLLRRAAPLERMLLCYRLRDLPTLRAVWSDFSPSVPLTSAGLLAALVGLLMGLLLAALAGRLVAGLSGTRHDRVGWR